MASSENINYPTSQSQQNAETANPFIAFKRLADQQISSLMNFALSSNPFSNKPSAAARQFKMDYETWLKESRDSRDRLEYEVKEAAGLMDLYRNAQRDAKGEHTGDDSDYDGSRCPYRGSRGEKLSVQDTEDLSTFLDQTAIQGDQQQNSLGSCHSNVPLTYLLHSEYSPLNLEQQRPLSQYGTAWRAAFEDLLDLNNGIGLPDHPHCPRRTIEDPHEWIQKLFKLGVGRQERLSSDFQKQSLQQVAIRAGCPGVQAGADGAKGDQSILEDLSKPATSIQDMGRAAFGAFFGGSLANARPSPKEVRRTVVHDDDGDDDDHIDEEDDEDDEDDDEDDNGEEDMDESDEESTELDLYLRLMGLEDEKARSNNSKEATKSRILAQLQHESGPGSSVDSDKPSILSTLTTTEKTTLQDGTTHTKVVLKRRFSDGREESHETVHTQNPLPDKSRQSIADPAKKKGANQYQDSETKGWFWS